LGTRAGISVFYRDAGGNVFHTYWRGVEQLVGTYVMLDMVPKGRDEDHQGFTRIHDRKGPPPRSLRYRRVRGRDQALLAGDDIGKGDLRRL